MYQASRGLSAIAELLVQSVHKAIVLFSDYVIIFCIGFILTETNMKLHSYAIF